MNKLRQRQVDALKKLAQIMGEPEVSGRAVIDYYTNQNRGDLFKAPGCARIHPIHRVNHSVCLECVRWDRASMVCKVGRESEKIQA